MSKQYARRCELCGLVFKAKRHDARYCSNACRSRAYRVRSSQGRLPGKKAANWQPLLEWRSYARLQAVSPDTVRLIRELAECYGPDAGKLALQAVMAFAGSTGYQW